MELGDLSMGLVGGAIIGLSASLLLLFNGRIAGISGIVGGLFGSAVGARAWRIAFLAGLILGPVLLIQVTGRVPTPVVTPLWLLLPAGLLVGYGTRMGSGCTSGHGVCGLARRSPRSLAAVLTFMATAMITVLMVRHVVGLA